jgi:hypothetical protein
MAIKPFYTPSGKEMEVLRQLADTLLRWGGYWNEYGSYGCGSELTEEEKTLFLKIRDGETTNG